MPPEARAKSSSEPLQRAIAIAAGWSRFTHVLLGCASIAVLSAADLATGPHISLAVFFIVPLAVVGWHTSRPWSVALATLAGFAWFMDFRPLLSPGMPAAVVVWSCCGRVGLFMAVVWLIGALRTMYDQQRLLATTDEVTGVANRRALIDLANREIARMARTGESLSLIYLDADRFKSVNDQLGHEEGDRLLRTVASALTEHCRKTDAVARLGGDEFAVLLPDTDGPAATAVAAKLRGLLHKSMTGHRWPVTFSFGVATFIQPPTSAEHMLRAADALQYAAKHGGRDGIVASAA